MSDEEFFGQNDELKSEIAEKPEKVSEEEYQ